ncbi:MAG: hypothetical protein AB7J13_16190 [Pyrinomonadaceae bacterium]
MESIPGYVSIVFILTTFATVGFSLQAAKAAGLQSAPSRLLLFILPLWIFFQAMLGLGGFYQLTQAMPPRLLIFGALPAFSLIAVYFIFFRRNFIERLPLGHLTLLHTVRIPVEMVLYWLFLGGVVPEVMTFAGRNFDILTGILAAPVYLIAFKGPVPKKWLLVAYNLLGSALLINIVSIAIASLPTPMQAMSFDQPNRAVLYFPYVWLPAIVVPIVLFSHLAALWQLLTRKGES